VARSLRRAAAIAFCVSLPVAVLVAPAAHAAGANTAAEMCRQADEAGLLDQPGVGITRGECVNIVKGFDNGSAGSVLSGLCGTEFGQQLAGVTNKGQCIKVAKAA
jgi:hypothetical protein